VTPCHDIKDLYQMNSNEVVQRSKDIMTSVIDTLVLDHNNEIRIQRSRNMLSGTAQKLPSKLRLKTVMDIGPMVIIESLCIKSIIKTI